MSKNEKKCHSCRNVIKMKAKFCPDCGARLIVPKSFFELDKKTLMISGILTIVVVVLLCLWFWSQLIHPSPRSTNIKKSLIKSSLELKQAKLNEDEKCAQNVSCLAKKNKELADQLCLVKLKGAKSSEMRLGDSNKDLFESYRWSNEASKIIRYSGNNLEVKHFLGHWIAHSYTCDFSTQRKNVIKVNLATKGLF